VTTSIWMDVDLPALDGEPPDEAEVLVIGAGIAGLTTAIELAKRGRQVVLIDDGPIGGGETARTSAHLASAVDDRYHLLEENFGRDGAAVIAASHAAAIDYIEATEIECDFKRVAGYLFAPAGRGDSELDEEYAAAKRAGLECELVALAPIVSEGRALRFANQAVFHPLRYLRGLMKLALKHGVEIHCGVHAEGIEEKSLHQRPLTVAIRNGDPVAASYVVDATNNDMSSSFSICLQQAPYRSYCVAFEIAKGALEHALYWETGDNYHYLRIVEGADHDVLIVGGEDHRVGQDESGPQFDALVLWTRRYIPAAGRVIDRWSGQIMEPVDGPAHIGKSAKLGNVFVCTGDSGNGLTHGTIAGLLIPALLDGESHPWAKVYDPSRGHAHAAGSYLAEATRSAIPYLDWIRGGDVSSIDDIPPGSGALIRDGLHLRAAYCDDAGRCHVMSAVCTHLKGIVQWNAVEKTWDCPCHGSRFDAYGEVINGPALANLEPVETPLAEGEPDPVTFEPHAVEKR
jgi:glycine/D-amino acid oxidase-like deaminating enzyme/nitrite reductase/ring-hydroxylating ferredoxin subunit